MSAHERISQDLRDRLHAAILEREQLMKRIITLEDQVKSLTERTPPVRDRDPVLFRESGVEPKWSPVNVNFSEI